MDDMEDIYARDRLFRFAGVPLGTTYREAEKMVMEAVKRYEKERDEALGLQHDCVDDPNAHGCDHLKACGFCRAEDERLRADVEVTLALQNRLAAERDEARAKAEQLRDLLRRVVQGWGSDERGCNPENYAAFEEAIAILECTGEERSDG